jgi:hypothetical protein
MTDVNLPEHRGTVIGFSRLTRAMGNALSVGLAGWLLVLFSLPAPNNYALTLALFQLLVIPAALCYVVVSRSLPQDIKEMRETLISRSKI